MQTALMSHKAVRENKCREYCMKSILKRAWAEISLNAVVENYKEIKNYIEIENALRSITSYMA